MSFLRRTAAATGAAAAVLLAVALLPGLPASAAATEPAPPPSLPWEYSSCVQANLFDVQPDTIFDNFVVTGTASECAPPTITDRPVGFGLVTYREQAKPHSIQYRYNLRMFPAPKTDGWTPTPVHFGAVAMAKRTGTYGVCVIAGPTSLDPTNPLDYHPQHVTCARVTVTALWNTPTEQYSVTMAPLAPYDPLVSGPVSHDPDGEITWPCGTCF